MGAKRVKLRAEVDVTRREWVELEFDAEDPDAIGPGMVEQAAGYVLGVDDGRLTLVGFDVQVQS